MANRISDLKPGDPAVILHHGHKQYGNEPYLVETTFVGFEGAPGDGQYAIFEDTKLYLDGHRWVYGSGAMPASLLLTTLPVREPGTMQRGVKLPDMQHYAVGTSSVQDNLIKRIKDLQKRR